ncbi:hypothetical protein AUR64_00835 [Haloprofundus marisrubri]|uniref:Uncharacterized protein n=1 Tax=Haloprofundus marisrubri TaxID=1514971 RepID=A0A0W1R4W3_9EURY|nr:hypothetical protein [Haloprofundus marisrubri]KTG08154.1 hypothetical protein AUR64_00835 [Haloprofundus marisrubri]
MKKTPGEADTSKNLGGFPNEHDGANFVGTTARGDPIYYNESSKEQYTAEITENTDAPRWTDRRQLGDDEGLGDVLDGFEWDELTDYAKEHLPGMSAGGESQSDGN